LHKQRQNSDENQVAATQRKAKTKTREQGKSDLPRAWRHMHTFFELNAGELNAASKRPPRAPIWWVPSANAEVLLTSSGLF
jgi:uncharacterized membrane protein YkvA (DUF1232 family)